MAKQNRRPKPTRKGGKPRGRRDSSRRDKDSEPNSVSEVKDFENSRGNPFELYNKNPLLTENAAKINSNNPLGMPYNVFNTTEVADDTVNKIPWKYFDLYESGVATINFLPTIGMCEEPTSPANIAFNNVYSYVRHANSGGRNYDSASLGMYITAADSAYMWYEVMVRLYGTLNLYSGMNKYYPRALVRAQGFDFDALVNQIPNLQFRINRYAKVLSTLYMPHFNIIDRHRWCCGNYFVDAPNAKAQTYVVKPVALYFLQETGTHEEPHDPLEYAVLECVQWSKMYAATNATTEGPNLLTFTEIDAICTNFEKLIAFSSDMALISGDISKAYQGNVTSLDMVPDMFELYPKYDETVLHMFHNATLEGSLLAFNSLRITQEFNDEGVYWYIYQKPLQPISGDSGSSFIMKHLRNGKRMVDFKVDNPSTELIVEGTRFTSMRGPENHKSVFGTEICTTIVLHYYEATGAKGEPRLVSKSLNSVAVHTDDQIEALGKLSAYNYAPGIFLFRTSGTTAEQTLHYLAHFYDVDNYTVLDYDALKKLHEMAILSEWDVPEMPGVK